MCDGEWERRLFICGNVVDKGEEIIAGRACDKSRANFPLLAYSEL
jgi:hypothetical protein